MKTRKTVKLFNILSLFTAAVFLAPLAIIPAANAEKKYNQVCNKTNASIDIVNAYKEKSIWYTEGWVNIQSNSCVNMYKVTSGFSNAYLYAEASKGTKTWVGTGEHIFCIDMSHNAKFKVSRANECDKDDVEVDMFGVIYPAKFVKIVYLNYHDICITPRGIFVCKQEP